MRAISEHEAIRRLKGASRRAVDIIGGPEIFQHYTRVRQAQISRYTLPSPEFIKYLMPLDVALAADREACTPLIASELARLQGYRLEHDTEQAAPCHLSYRDIGTLSSEFNDVTRETFEALENGEIDNLERKSIQRELDELKREIATYEQKLWGAE